MTSGTSTASKPTAGKAPYYAFVSDNTDLATFKSFAEKNNLPAAGALQGDAAQAAEFLKSNPSPSVLFVEVPSATAATDMLNKLADVCDPATKVVVVGTVNEYSFYCWLMDLGISSYLLRPLTVQALEGAWTKATEAPKPASQQAREPGHCVGFIGARGGVGSTTLSIMVAALLAEANTKEKTRKVAVVDLDPQDGSVSLLLDLDPSRGLREALERPDRIDALFLDRVMQKTTMGFSVLSAEEGLHEQVNYHAQAAEMLISELRQQFDLLIFDLPRRITPFVRTFLAVCDPLFVVSDLTLLGLRDSLRLSDLFRDFLRIKPPLFVLNRVGMAAKHEMNATDFKKGLNADVRFHVPFQPEFFMGISSEMTMLKQKKSAGLKVLEQMVALVQPKDAENKAGGFWAKKG